MISMYFDYYSGGLLSVLAVVFSFAYIPIILSL